MAAEAARLGGPPEVDQVTDYAAIVGYGIMSTPGIVIERNVGHACGLPTAEDLAKWLSVS